MQFGQDDFRYMAVRPRRMAVSPSTREMIMRRKYLVFIAALLVLLLAACQGAVVDTPVTTEAPTVDAVTLPETVDVQTVASVKDQDNVYLIDVREQWEYDEGHIPGVTLIPMNTIPDRLDEIPTSKEVIVTCRTGNRSGQVADYLRQIGYENVHNMAGGIVAWEAAGYPVER